jgi:hypothetical protein
VCIVCVCERGTSECVYLVYERESEKSLNVRALHRGVRGPETLIVCALCERESRSLLNVCALYVCERVCVRDF